MSPHIFLVAGEESGDRLGAALIAAIKQRTQGRAQFSCVGGTSMATEGVPVFSHWVISRSLVLAEF